MAPIRSKRPARPRPRHLEGREQQYLFDWARLYRLEDPPDPEEGDRLADYMYAIPNGGKRDAKEAARLKGQGAKAGVSDIHLPIPVGQYTGLWIELKYGDNYPTPDQKAWGRKMVACGHAFRVCWGWLAAKHVLIEYLDGRLQGEPYEYRKD